VAIRWTPTVIPWLKKHLLMFDQFHDGDIRTKFTTRALPGKAVLQEAGLTPVVQVAQRCQVDHATRSFRWPVRSTRMTHTAP
jgi:hypothetical protein